MALDLFRIIGGLDIESQNLATQGNANVLTGKGLPGGDAGVQDAAPIGSMYLRNDAEADNLQIYYKWSTANNSSADWRQTTSKEYVDAVAQGLSWREPVRVMDDTSYANSAAFPTTGTIDGVALSDGDRVLFSNVTNATDNNVWIWDATGTSWTEDTNDESDGDALLVQEGTNAETQWTYDGTNWVLFGSAAGAAELGYIRTFIGKTGPGSETPTYTSTNIVSNGDNLEVAIGKIDSAAGTRTYTEDNIVTDGETFTSSIDALDIAIGDRAYTEDNIVTDGQTITASIDALDIAVGNLVEQTTTFSGTNVAASNTPVDTIAVATATEIKWLVQVRENATPANRRAIEIHAMTDGTSTDFTTYSVLKLGAAIPGFDVSVDINGTDMRLLLSATNNVDYVVKRIGFSAF